MKYHTAGCIFYKKEEADEGNFTYNTQGQLIAKYRTLGNDLRLDPIYDGTRRFGILKVSDVSWLHCPQPWLLPCNPYRTGLSLGKLLQAELTDRLNNVRVVIKDRLMPVSNKGGIVAYYKPLVHEISDYYPYRWQKILGRYEFGANAGSLFEDWDSTRGTYYTLYRLLDARIVRWYQVEPKIDQYAMWSGYVVNMGNPVVAVDPFGRDTVWRSQPNGKMQKHVEAKGKDVFISDITQKEVSEAGVAPENSLEKVRRVSGTFVDDRYNERSDFVDIYRIRGDSNAQRLFEFLADNTGVEWSWWATGIPGSKGLNFVSTSGLSHRDYSAVWLFNTQLRYGYNLRLKVNSHPTSPEPSGLGEDKQDIGVKNNILNYIKKVYPKKYGYTPRLKVAIYTPRPIYDIEKGQSTRYLYYQDINTKEELRKKYIVDGYVLPPVKVPTKQNGR